LDKNPKIPIDVNIIKTIRAVKKYILNSFGISFQLLYNHEATTSLDASNNDPIIAIGIAAAAKIATSPAMA
jgi:hypothetical protein